jgi:hypothetical protein
MKIDLSKKYKTANGLQVELYKQHDIGAFPIVGAIFNENFWYPVSWSVTGNSGVNFNWNLEEIVDFKTSYLIEKYSTYVEYFGLPFSVSVNVKWLATDEDGTVYGYFDEPYSICKPLGFSGFWDSDSDSVKLLKIKFAGDWRHSKIEVKTDK